MGGPGNAYADPYNNYRVSTIPVSTAGTFSVANAKWTSGPSLPRQDDDLHRKAGGSRVPPRLRGASTTRRRTRPETAPAADTRRSPRQRTRAPEPRDRHVMSRVDAWWSEEPRRSPAEYACELAGDRFWRDPKRRLIGTHPDFPDVAWLLDLDANVAHALVLVLSRMPAEGRRSFADVFFEEARPAAGAMSSTSKPSWLARPRPPSNAGKLPTSSHSFSSSPPCTSRSPDRLARSLDGEVGTRAGVDSGRCGWVSFSVPWSQAMLGS